jgi:hypothetical protein
MGPAESEPPVTDGVWWSIQLTCSACGSTRQHSNDARPRVHLGRSPAKETALQQRRIQARTRAGRDPRGGEKECNHDGRGVQALNLERVCGALLNGGGYGQYSRSAVLAGDLRLSQRTWERHAVQVWHAAETVATRELTRYIHRLCETNMAIGVSADGAWNKRREAAKHCLALHHDRRPIYLICPEKSVTGEKDHERVVVRSGNYESSSKNMEAAAWSLMALELDAIDRRFRPLVTSVCVDRDASVTQTIRVSLARILFVLHGHTVLHFSLTQCCYSVGNFPKRDHLQ